MGNGTEVNAGPRIMPLWWYLFATGAGAVARSPLLVLW